MGQATVMSEVCQTIHEERHLNHQESHTTSRTTDATSRTIDATSRTTNATSRTTDATSCTTDVTHTDTISGTTTVDFHPSVTFHRPVLGGGSLVASDGHDSAGYHTADDEDNDDGLTTTTNRAISIPEADW